MSSVLQCVEDRGKAMQFGHAVCHWTLIAHHDGNYFADDETLRELEDTGRVAFHYCDETGAVTDAANPNGSQLGIAGIYNKRKNVLGMMPHPERMADAELGGADGQPMFRGLVQALS